MDDPVKKLKEDVAMLQKAFNKLQFQIKALDKQNRSLKTEVQRLNNVITTLLRKS